MSNVLAGSASKFSIAGENNLRSSSNRSVAISHSQPNHFWLASPQNSLIVKVPVLRHNCKAFLCHKRPDSGVTGSAKAALVNMRRVGKQICQPKNKLRRQVFIEQELHQRRSLFCVLDRRRRPDRLGYPPRSGKENHAGSAHGSSRR